VDARGGRAGVRSGRRHQQVALRDQLVERLLEVARLPLLDLDARLGDD